ncbi:D-amino acid aminotransferase [Chitinibacter bivalviorum]|uniref:D-amino acid aminotransferase n=1 Tax=Chitinibacter bivalviorum TaxID=2739434 RepID=A0A7H9BIU2_9NEIS|nr:D-amino acid aminotransferase [Chitinibacter bivalviorum]QLG88573.1 D-amino acid aminotransferase [Chitinibacter bivalviorum]
MPIPQLIAYLNGQFAPLNELNISVMDRGFLFGDGVYEMIPVYSRRPFRLDEHLARLTNSLAAIQLCNPYTQAQWRALVLDLVAKQSFADQSVYVQVTRGVAYPRNHAFPAGETVPTVFALADPLELPPARAYELGVAAVTTRDLRWQRCDIKAISLLANVLAKQQAVEAGAAETIMLRDGLMIEGAASNIFIVQQGVIYAPQTGEHMLAGITYELVIELAQSHGLPLVLGEVSEAMLRNADEVWLTSSSKEILPIVQLDGRVVGKGVPGPIYQAMISFYQNYKATVMRRGEE